MTTGRTRYCSRCLTTFDGDPEACPNLACRGKRRRTGWGTMLEGGDTLDRHYRVEKCLAIGGAGVTYLAQALNDADETVGPRLAIKVLFSHRDHGPYLRRLSTEAQILQELEHPNIVRTMGFVNRAGQSPYLITRFEAGGSLLDHLRRVGAMNVKALAGVGVQLCDALAVAHGKGVIHRDIKPENILLAQVASPGETPLVRITDFGIAKVFGGVGDRLTRVGAFVGTPQYAAPEQFEGLTPSPATDLYAVAAVLLFCNSLNALLPADMIMDPVDLREELVKRLPPMLAKGGSAEELTAFNHFLAATMAAEPGDRVGVAQARAMLNGVVTGQFVMDPLPGQGGGLPTNASLHQGDSELKASASLTFLFNPDTQEVAATEARAAGLPGEQDLAPKPEWPDVNAPTDVSGEANRDALDQLRGAGEGDLAKAALPNETTGLTSHSLTQDEHELPIKKKRSKALPMMGCLGLLGALACGGGAVGTWVTAPWSMPTEALDFALPPATLVPDKAEHVADYQAIFADFQPAMVALKDSCGITAENTVLVYLVIEPTGRMRSIKVGGLDAKDAGCVGSGLKDVTFSRVESSPLRWRPVTVGLQYGG